MCIRDSNGTDSGSAYVFSLPPEGVSRYCGTNQNPNNAAVIDIDTTDSSSASILVNLASAPANQFVYLLVGNGNATVSQPPGAKGDLCVVGGSCLGRYDKDVGQITSVGTFTTDIQNALSNPCAEPTPERALSAMRAGMRRRSILRILEWAA